MHVQDDRPDDTMILNYLPPIGIRAGESALKGDALRQLAASLLHFNPLHK